MSTYIHTIHSDAGVPTSAIIWSEKQKKHFGLLMQSDWLAIKDYDALAGGVIGNVPIIAYSGEKDPLVMGGKEKDWQTYTTSNVSMSIDRGGI